MTKINTKELLEKIIELMATDFYKVMKDEKQELISEFVEDLKRFLPNFAKDRTTLDLMEVYIENTIEKWEEKLK